MRTESGNKGLLPRRTGNKPEISTGHLHTIRQQCRYGSECITGLAVVLLRDQIIASTWIKAPEMFE